MRTDKRAVGIIVKDGQILIMRRVRNGNQYFVFPGGGVEEGETEGETVMREMKEELNLDVEVGEKMFEHFNQPENRGWKVRTDCFYWIKQFSGQIELGGPEKATMSEDNRYYPEWHNIAELKNMNNLYPEHERLKVAEILET